LLNAARFRMVVFASKQVLQALANVERSRGTATWEDANVHWFSALRTELGSPNQQVADNTIAVVLWPSKYKSSDYRPQQKPPSDTTEHGNRGASGLTR